MQLLHLHLIESKILLFYLSFHHLFLFLLLFLFIPDENAEALFLKPILNLSKIPIIILFQFLLCLKQVLSYELNFFHQLKLIISHFQILYLFYYSVRLFNLPAKAVAHAAVPHALVKPAPLSQTFTLIK